jgi:hypothetical protein
MCGATLLSGEVSVQVSVCYVHPVLIDPPTSNYPTAPYRDHHTSDVFRHGVSRVAGFKYGTSAGCPLHSS